MIGVLIGFTALLQTARAAEQASLLESGFRGRDYAAVSLYSETYRVNSAQPGNQYPSLVVGGKAAHMAASWQAVGDAEGLLNVGDTSARYVNVREAYVATAGEPGSVRAAFGRKLENWSLLDSYWQLGLWQPRFRWNYLNPDVVGLTGFFVSKETQNVQLLAFASPLFIPELGAQFDLKDGAFTSANRFVTAPPPQIALGNANIPVRYQLDSTSVKDIVMHPSAGAMARVGGSRGAWGKASYIYEPVNRIMLGYEGYLYVNRQDVEVTLHPRVVFHHLAALEAGYSQETWSTWFSVLGEHPLPDSAPGYWTTEKITPAVMASSTVDFEAFHGSQGPTHFSLSYIFSRGGANPDEGPLASPGKSIFESRYPYRSASSLRADVPLLRSGLRGLDLSTKGIYEYTVSGVLLSVDLLYHAAEHWSFDLGADLVGSSSPTAPDGGADFMYLYRSDDRIRGKVSYVF